MEALRQVANPRYNGILFRRTFPRLEAADGMIARSERWYPAYGGRFNASKYFWRFPSGARIYFGHMQREADKLDYQGSQFGFIGFDELTEFEQSQYMYLFTRCRVPAGSGLRAYSRSATNPGNIGHNWVKRRFITVDIVNRLKYFALIDEVDTLVDRNHPDALSRAFFPALLADNPSADPDYRRRILMNPDPVERARLLGGDWDITSSAGQIYPDWSFENISDEADYHAGWEIVWGADDGYAEGRGQGTESYHPRVILIGQYTPIGGLNIFYEYYRTGVASYQPTIHEALSQPVGLPDNYKPENFKRPHDAYPMPEIAYIDSSAAMFKGALLEQDIHAIGATHAVSEGIKNLRRMVRDGNGMRLLKIHPRCKNLIREIAGYRHADSAASQNGETKPLKVDDHGCLIAGTLITTARGLIPIEHISAGDFVLTRQGFRRVIVSGMTHSHAEVYTVSLSNGALLTGTGNHPVYVNSKGYIALRNLAVNDILIPSKIYQRGSRWTSLSQSLRKLYLTALNSGGIRNQKIGQMPIIFAPIRDTSKKASGHFIVKSGKQPMGIFQKVTKFITQMAIPAIIASITSSASRNPTIISCTLQPIPNGKRSGYATGFPLSVFMPLTGTNQQRDVNGIGSRAYDCGKTPSLWDVSANNVAKLMKRWFVSIVQCFAPMRAEPNSATYQVSITKLEPVNNVDRPLNAINIPLNDSAPIGAPLLEEELPSVVSIDLQPQKQAVYNLTIDAVPEYFANGILVHNCDVARYMAWPLRIPD